MIGVWRGAAPRAARLLCVASKERGKLGRVALGGSRRQLPRPLVFEKLVKPTQNTLVYCGHAKIYAEPQLENGAVLERISVSPRIWKRLLLSVTLRGTETER